jgi:tripartite-type tricarboxylate transporter receptor subunit TctC
MTANNATPRHPRCFDGAGFTETRTRWIGVGAPKNTPAEIIDMLNKEISAALADPKKKARLADLGFTPLVLSPTDLGILIADETEKWGKVIKFANIKPE